MTDNPYKPPTSNPSKEKQPLPAPIKGVVLGALTDFFGTIVSSSIVTVSFYSDVPFEELSEQALSVNAFSVITSGLGCLFSALGGYVCASYAREYAYRSAFALAALMIILGKLLSFDTYSVWIDIMFALMTLGFIMLGALLCVHRRRPMGATGWF